MHWVVEHFVLYSTEEKNSRKIEDKFIKNNRLTKL